MFFSSGVFLVWAFCSSLAILPAPQGALEVDARLQSDVGGRRRRGGSCGRGGGGDDGGGGGSSDASDDGATA